MKEAVQIESKIIKTDIIRWKDLIFLQDENFKEWIDQGDRKLIDSILKYQFIDPFKVWQNGDIIYCLDGKHRFLDLQLIEQSGTTVPELLPATFLDCNDIHEAAELVLIYSSQYAKITQQGLFDFVSKFNIEVAGMRDTVHIPDFSMERFEQKFGIINTTECEEPWVDIEQNVMVRPGDLFEINDHKVICGTFKDDHIVSMLMGKSKARIVTCDPPYNLPANFFTNKENSRHDNFAEAAGEMSDDQFVKFLALIMQKSIDNTVSGAIHYIFMDFRHVWHMTEAARLTYGNPQPKQVCVWAKDLFANGSFYRAQHELCFMFKDPRDKALWNKDLIDNGGDFYKESNEWCFIFKNGNAKHLSHLELKDRIRTNVWKYPSSTSLANPDRYQLQNHPTPKPVQMIADSVLDTTNRGDLVVDWFLGSGTALIACEHTQRIGRFTEIEPKFVQGAIIRFLNYCDKLNKKVTFTHHNGKLTLKNFRDEQRKIQSSDRNER